MRPQYFLTLFAAAATVLGGCSAKDPVTRTPVYHVGTPTNRSTTYSWVPHNEPFYVQPGLNGGKARQPIKDAPWKPRFEPYSPLAASVYDALKATGIDTTYITTSTLGDSVIVEGRLSTKQDRDKALATARTVPGVKTVIDHVKVE